ncbi:pyridoxal phosphate-dependent aminotransferase [Methanomethylophilus alvi]|uniref:pyridoxal phosphate-dependent aminotransferase n=1 Tax=Methanomethylophilus alvi TaxID=1291540 RepID=UPI0037DD8309
MRIVPRNELRDLPKTVHGGQGWRLTGVEDFSQNLNPLGPPPELKDEILNAVSEIGHYPDASNEVPKKAVADYFGLDIDNVAMGAGSSEIIRNFPAAFMVPGDRVLMMRPSFAEYAQQCRIAGASIDFMDLMPEDDFRIDSERLSQMVRDNHYKAVYICNPNNPTGRIEKREKVLDIVKECEDLGTMVFLDETLLGLSPEAASTSLTKYVGKFSNLLIADSLTKSFAIPGMRIGFGLSSPEIISELEKVQLPWNLGTLEQAVAAYLMEYRMDYPDVVARELRAESAYMHSRLDDIGFPVGPLSDSFFYFVSVEDLGLTGEEMKRLMLKGSVMIRDCASFGDRFRGYIRYCVKDRSRNARFMAAAESVMDELQGR